MKKYFKFEEGITLIEVLVTLVVLSIVSGVIYSVFITGLKLYQKIGIESQLRDDADYIATMILNEMYNSPPNFITNVEKGIIMERLKAKSVEGYLVEDSKIVEKKISIYFENNTFYIKRENLISGERSETQLALESSQFTTIDGENTSISTTCDSTCQHGRIELKLILEDDKISISNMLKTEPLILESSFGF